MPKLPPSDFPVAASRATLGAKIRGFLKKPLSAAHAAYASIVRPAATLPAPVAAAPEPVAPAKAGPSPLMQAIGHLFRTPEHVALTKANAEVARLESQIAALDSRIAALDSRIAEQVREEAAVKKQIATMCAGFGLRPDVLAGKARAEIHALLESQCRQLAAEQAECLGFQLSGPEVRAACKMRGPEIAGADGPSAGVVSAAYPTA